MLYLPRLYAYHTEAAPPGARDGRRRSRRWKRKLLKIIINPAMIAAWIFGLWLIWLRSGSGAGWAFLPQPWMIAKLAGVIFLTGWHGFLAVARKRFAAGTNQTVRTFWRMTNEMPFLAAIVMVLSVTLEFGPSEPSSA